MTPPRRLAPDTVLVLASHNAGKVKELAELFAPHVRMLRSVSELGLAVPEEPGETFAAIAAHKARAAASGGSVAVADDSGLVVPALGGAPGVRSARWAHRNFEAAMEDVHRALGEHDRRAKMVCALALAWPDAHAEVFVGEVEGELVWPPRGALGFGYEPMFRPDGSAHTYGEMERSEKHADDPRARAFALLRAACLSRAC